MILCDDSGELLPPRLRLLALLPLAESVVFGLVARRAYDAGTTQAVWLTLTFLFLFPMAVGYRTVARSDEPRVGLLPPSAFALMLLAAGIAQGGAAVLVTVLLTPLFVVMAVIGGVLALLVRLAFRVAAHVAAWIRRPPASPRDAVRGALLPRVFSPLPATECVRPAAEPRDSWQQVLIRVPL
ncbi:hypothetical protein [Longimicrobium sp.]|uniref:hypothetical protein n=1 Tax=Longimicrobium sp. TaxID=2029185 RepID=UPI002E30E7C6|nr:hypothetical protein [Longimicrobium sp.]HEX6036489.1 hypothetical protein [Longimicrobium sp.]